MSSTPEAVTRHWLETVVVGLNFCPFAKRELVSERVRIAVQGPGEDKAFHQQRILALAREFQILDNDEDVSTTLLVFPGALADFEDFLDFLTSAEELLQSLGYEGTYQLASFHPGYRFEGSDEGDAANYTNRSPYAMVHILREALVTAALKDYHAPEMIPERNKQVCRELGISALAALLKSSV